MKEQKDNSRIKILDRKWSEKLRKLRKWNKNIKREYSRGKFRISSYPKIIVDNEKKEIILTPLKKYTRKAFELKRNNLHKKIRQVSKLSTEISSKEKKKLIKEYYRQRCSDIKTRAELWIAKYDPDLSLEERNERITRLHRELFPITSLEQREVFINEFITFLKFLINKDLYGVNELSFINELIDCKFYDVKGIGIKIDFEKATKEFLNDRETFLKEEKKTYNSEEVEKIVKEFIRELNLEEYTKTRVKNKPIFSVNFRGKVTIPKYSYFTQRRLLQVLVHEIGVHAMRSVNGKRNITNKNEKLKLLGVGKSSRNITTEEGLATYIEQNIFFKSNKYDLFSLFPFYLRLIAVHLALNYRPFTIYEKLEKLCLLYAKIQGKNDAFAYKTRDTLITRIYKNYERPSKGDVNPKVALYLVGNRLIWDFVENGGDINELFVGKVRIEDLEEVKRMGFRKN